MDYRPFYKAVSAWNKKKSLKNFKRIYLDGFTYEKAFERPVLRLFKIIKNTFSGKYKESEEELKNRWEIIKDDLTVDDKLRLTLDPKTPGHFLSCLADEENPFIHTNAIINPNIPLYKLWDLTFDENWAKRHAILLNPKVSDEILKKLSKDSNVHICFTAERKLNERENKSLDEKLNFFELKQKKGQELFKTPDIKKENVK